MKLKNFENAIIDNISIISSFQYIFIISINKIISYSL